MKIDTFEDIISWQLSQDLIVRVYKVFSSNTDFGFRDQICRAAVSIGNNIAEGFERRSNNEFKHFLFIAKGSCGEVRSMSISALNLGYLSKDQQLLLYNSTIEISKLISGLIKKL